MQSPEIRRNITAIAALIVPVLAVKLTTIVLGQPSAQQASAEPKPVAAVTTPAATAKTISLTPHQIAAMQYIQTLRTQPFGPAPIRSEFAAITIAQPTAPVQTLDNESGQLAAIPELAVTAVMSTSGIVSGSDNRATVQPVRRALINGRPYREGETVKGTTWKIASIDCNTRAVTLLDTQSDRTVTVNVMLPQ